MTPHSHNNSPSSIISSLSFRYKLTGEGSIRTRGIFVRLLTTVAALRCYLTKRCSENKLIAVTEDLKLDEMTGWYQTAVGLVPTMGNLHQGHLSLIQRARQEVFSVFDELLAIRAYSCTPLVSAIAPTFLLSRFVFDTELKKVRTGIFRIKRVAALRPPTL